MSGIIQEESVILGGEREMKSKLGWWIQKELGRTV